MDGLHFFVHIVQYHIISGDMLPDSTLNPRFHIVWLKLVRECGQLLLDGSSEVSIPALCQIWITKLNRDMIRFFFDILNGIFRVNHLILWNLFHGKTVLSFDGQARLACRHGQP